MNNRISTFIQRHQLFSEGSTIIVGFSGGPDSMFLLHSLAPLHQAGTITVIAAHLDHGWRPTSANDARFCLQAAHALGIECVIGHLNDVAPSIAWNGSQEEVGRTARRFFLQQIAAEKNANHIALAHHAQDQQETFFIRLIRGSSIAGLASMLPKAGIYIRPLLTTSKSEILAYLHDHAIAYLVDETNESDAYLRNRIRHTVLPALHAADSRFDHNFEATLGRLQSAADFLDQHAHQVFTQISTTHQAILHINCASLCALHPALQYHVLVAWMRQEMVPFPVTQRFFDEIIKFACTHAGGSHQLHHAWRLKKKKGWIWLEK